MPLTKQQAQQLKLKVDAISDTSSATTQASSKTWNETVMAQIKLDDKTLDQRLLEIRKQWLDTKSVLIKVELETGISTDVRFYPYRESNVELSIDDIFARGIDVIRACNEIRINGANSSKVVEDPLLLEVLNVFRSRLQELKSSEDKKSNEMALKELKKFNGALVDYLVNKDLFQNDGKNSLSESEQREKAIKAINFVRDFLFKRDVSTAFCVEDKIDATNSDKSVSALRFFNPFTISDKPFAKKSGVTYSPWSHYEEQGWFKYLAKKTTSNRQRNWLINFIENNKDELHTLSSTPMSRFTPNPANAVDTTNIVIGKDSKIELLSNNFRTAISQPIGLSSNKEIQKVTDWNHLCLLLPRLEGELNAYMDKWGELYGKGDIPFTMLHQTLIGDEVSFTPDQTKAKQSKVNGSVIDTKINANNKMRAMLAHTAIFRNRETGKLVYLSKNKYDTYIETKEKLKKLDKEHVDFNKQSKIYNDILENIVEEYPIIEELTEQKSYQGVNVQLLDVNNCVNIWHLRARVRNNDIESSRQLIKNAVSHLDRVKFLGDEKSTEALNLSRQIIIDFLNSSDYSLMSSTVKRGHVKIAINYLCTELTSPDSNVCDLNHLQSRKSLALGLQAAVELKCCVHETYWSMIRRKVGNYTRDNFRKVPVIGHAADWFVRAGMGFANLLVKTVFNVLTLGIPLIYNWIKHKDDRKTVYKSAYEGLLTESILGNTHGGCMSSLDRAGELSEFRMALVKQFADTGKISGYNDRDKENDLIKKYGSTRAKHHAAEMLSGIEATKDGETKGFDDAGLILSNEDKQEQSISKKFSGLRKGSYDKKVSLVKYLNPKSKAGKNNDVEDLTDAMVRSGKLLDEKVRNLSSSVKQRESNKLESSKTASKESIVLNL